MGAFETASAPDQAWKVGALAKAAGLTVRALHYYDHIGLLTPSRRTPAGHRLYDGGDVARLYRISLLRRLGFPLEQIAEFCQANYGVTFPMFSKIDVLPPNKAPLYHFLTEASTDPQFPGEVKWNFEKFLISRNGQIVGRYLSPVKPMSDEIVKSVEAELAK